MNYRHVYMCIIAHAKLEMKEGKRPSEYQKKKDFPDQYFEFHHIFPKSLFPQYENFKQNLVALTAREHFFCHQLLTKIYPGPSMYAALAYMSSRKKCSSREYAICRKALVDFNRSRSRKSVLASIKKTHETIKSRLENDEDFRIKYIESKKRAGKAGNTDSAKRKRQQTRSGKSYTESCKAGFEKLKKSEKYNSWLDKVGSSNRNKKWFNDGVNEIRSYDKPIGYSEGRLFYERPHSIQKGGKNNNATKVKDTDTGLIFETMKAFCSAYNLKTSQLRDFMKAHDIKRTKIINISVNILLIETS